MAGFANDLKQRFDWAMYQSQEAYTVQADGISFERSAEDEHAIGVFKALLDTVDAIPLSLVHEAERLRSRAPDLFEKSFSRALRAVGAEPDLVCAADFVEVLLGATGV